MFIYRYTYIYIYVFCFVNSYYVIVLKISQVLWGAFLYPILIHPQSEVPISCWSGHLLDCGFHGGDEHLAIHELWTVVKRKVPRYTKVYVTWGFFNWIPKTVAFNTKMVDFWMIWGTPHDWRQLQIVKWSILVVEAIPEEQMLWCRRWDLARENSQVSHGLSIFEKDITCKICSMFFFSSHVWEARG